MATTFTWNVAQLHRELEDGYVYTADWTLHAVSSEMRGDEPYQIFGNGSTNFERPETDLIPFDDLTKDQVIGWVQDKIGADKVTEIEAAIEAQLAEQITPTRGQGVPWQ